MYLALYHAIQTTHSARSVVQSLCAQANKAAAEIGDAQVQMMQYDANTDAIDEHVRGFAGQQEELEADVERSKSRQMTAFRSFQAHSTQLPKVKTLTGSRKWRRGPLRRLLNVKFKLCRQKSMPNCPKDGRP
jgi:hypothetical protein